MSRSLVRAMELAKVWIQLARICMASSKQSRVRNSGDEAAICGLRLRRGRTRSYKSGHTAVGICGRGRVRPTSMTVRLLSGRLDREHAAENGDAAVAAEAVEAAEASDLRGRGGREGQA